MATYCGARQGWPQLTPLTCPVVTIHQAESSLFTWTFGRSDSLGS